MLVRTLFSWRRLGLGAIALALALIGAGAFVLPAVAQTAAPPAPTGLTATAGDGSVSLSWNDPADPSIRGYEYRVNHNATSTGRLTGWGKWRSIEGGDSSITSHTFANLTNGREYRYKLRAVNSSGAGAAAPNSAPWFVSATPQIIKPPAAPTGLTATAGDQSVSLSWDDPSDSSITGYEYRVNHNDTSTGNLSGWGKWQSIAGSGSDTASHTFANLTNGREYRYRLRAANSGGAGAQAPNARPWFVSATPQAPPAAPANVQVEINLNVMTVSWDAVSGADGYDARTKTGSADWVIAASSVAGTSVDVNILEVPDYVGVRAHAGSAAGAWTDVSRLPPPDVFEQQASGGAGASAQSAQTLGAGAQAAQVQPQNALAAPTNVKVTRSNGGGAINPLANESLTIKWNSVQGATGYRIACNYLSYNDWRKCGKDGSNNWKEHGTTDGTTGVTVSYLDGPTNDANAGSWKRMTYGSEFSVTVQAMSGNTPGDWSAAVNAYPAFPIFLMEGSVVPPGYQGLDASVRTATGFTLAWTHPYRATGYVAECVEIVGGQESGSWTKCSENANVFSGQNATIEQAHLYGLTLNSRIITGIAIDDLDLATSGKQALDPTKSYDVRVRTTNPAGESPLNSYPPRSIRNPHTP